MQNTDARDRRVCPVNRYFDGQKIHRLSQQQNFNVEGKSINSLSAKNFLRGAMSKALKSALGIPDIQSGHPLGNSIKNFPHPFSTNILALKDASFRVLTIPHDHVDGSILPHALEAGIQILERRA